jgi:hypothetical protein
MLTLTEDCDLSALISEVRVTICLERFSMIFSLSEIAWALGISFCHLTYLSLSRLFSYSRVRKALCSLKKPSSEPWISPRINVGSSTCWVRMSVWRTLRTSSKLRNSLLNSLITEGLPLRFLETTPNSLSKFSNLDWSRRLVCLRDL